MVCRCVWHFAVAIKAKGDILVLDEVLAVGDEAFQRKCDNFFTEVKQDPTKTVILVTHSMDSVKKYCNKAILIKDGEIIASGNQGRCSRSLHAGELQEECRSLGDDANNETDDKSILRVLVNECPPLRGVLGLASGEIVPTVMLLSCALLGAYSFKGRSGR